MMAWNYWKGGEINPNCTIMGKKEMLIALVQHNKDKMVSSKEHIFSKKIIYISNPAQRDTLLKSEFVEAVSAVS
jgi:hypothetical protein